MSKLPIKFTRLRNEAYIDSKDVEKMAIEAYKDQLISEIEELEYITNNPKQLYWVKAVKEDVIAMITKERY